MHDQIRDEVFKQTNSATVILPDPGSPSHDSAMTHVTGRSEFVDDRPMLMGELHCGLIYSPFAHARVMRLDTQAALQIPGVLCAVTAADVVHNIWGTIIQDQPIIAADHVHYVGEVVAVLGALTKEALAKGLAAVVVQWEKLPDIRSIDEAVAAKNFIGTQREIVHGHAQLHIQQSPHTLNGVLTIEGADHFYLESQAAVVYPREDGQLEVHSSTQHPTETQHVVAKACGLRFSDVVCIAKRLGGGFGGKESQAAPIAAYAALIAKKSGRAARLAISKDDDMIITGKRNPFQIHYQCGFDRQGKILALVATLYSDGGAYADLSTSIMERALLHCDNAYFIPNMHVRGQVCRTNFHPHTAFRGFGGPKGVALIESIIEDIAVVTKHDALDIRKLNCYAPGRDTTHYGQQVENNFLPALFEKLEQTCDYRARRQQVAQWNADRAANPHEHLRGLSLTAVKFGISFTTRFLNQGNALVNIHGDGTVQVSTGAVEMGQGVNARIAAIVAEQFGLPLQSIRMMPTSTEKNANTSPTAASAGTDLNGAAAAVACDIIKQRLASIALQLRCIPEDAWANKTAGLGTRAELLVDASVTSSGTSEQRIQFHEGLVTVTQRDGGVFTIAFTTLVREAYLNRISISAYGHYATPHMHFDKVLGKGRPFLYFTQGVAASEVQLDRYTGEIKVRRVDILMDMGRPVNHALDMGQVMGGFIQGMGWMTTEHLVYNEDGLLLSHSPSTYKIPSVQDTPRIFNADLIFNEGNTVNVRATKASGEPPLLLAISVWTAVRNAIAAARVKKLTPEHVSHDHAPSISHVEWLPTLQCVPLAIPATAERVLRALAPEDFAPWESQHIRTST